MVNSSASRLALDLPGIFILVLLLPVAAKKSLFQLRRSPAGHRPGMVGVE
jgi:hypothetical protein